jgi:phosphoglycolate phosphatase
MIFLFDIDGTLLLSGGAGRQALEFATDRHLPVSNTMDVVLCAGRTDPLIVEDACVHALGHAPDQALYDRIVTDYLLELPATLAASEGYHLMPGVPEVIHELNRKEHTWLAVATGNLEAGARLKLAHGDLERLFPVGGFADGVRERSQILRNAVSALEADTGRTEAEMGPVVVVGDTVHDIRAARECGFLIAAIANTTTAHEALEELQPDLLMTDLRDLLAWSAELDTTD